MDIVQLIQLFTSAPTTIILLYLLVKEQQAHAETRKARDEQNQQWIERYAGLSEKVTTAVERLDLPGPH